MNIFISGSLAYDRIMDFPGHFADHILPDKIHMLNVCFNINSLIEKFGGTAGNIAYSLSLLDEKPFIVATCGKDFLRYEKWLDKLELPRRWIKPIPHAFTAGAYITTDFNDNQITAFNMGAMAFEADLPALDDGAGPSIVFIGPGNKNDMIRFAEKARRAKMPFIFDPGQSLNIWNGAELREAVRGALCFISNDYELSQFLQMTGWDISGLHKAVEVVITTAGPKGSVLDIGGEKTRIPAVTAEKVVDPTGAGDAFRAGIIKAFKLNMSWDAACRMGATVASFSVEHYGTQEHDFDRAAFCGRYESAFGTLSAKK